MNDFDKAYWNKYWAAKMPWEEFVTHVQAGVPATILAAKLGMALRPTYFKWAKRAKQEVISGQVQE